MRLLKKAWTTFQERPTYLFQYGRGWVLFHWALLLGFIFLNKKRVFLESNVRFQSIRNFMASSPQSRITVGADSVIYENARLEAHGEGHITVGAQSILGDTRMASRKAIHIGDRFLSSWNTLIQDFDPHPTSQSLRADQLREMTFQFQPCFATRASSPPKSLALATWEAVSAPITIGDDVWMGANAVILKGSKIGHGCIIAAGAVVTGGEFPDRSLIAGNPAKVIKELPE